MLLPPDSRGSVGKVTGSAAIGHIAGEPLRFALRPNQHRPGVTFKHTSRAFNVAPTSRDNGGTDKYPVAPRFVAYMVRVQLQGCQKLWPPSGNPRPYFRSLWLFNVSDRARRITRSHITCPANPSQCLLIQRGPASRSRS